MKIQIPTEIDSTATELEERFLTALSDLVEKHIVVALELGTHSCYSTASNEIRVDFAPDVNPEFVDVESAELVWDEDFPYIRSRVTSNPWDFAGGCSNDPACREHQHTLMPGCSYAEVTESIDSVFYAFTVRASKGTLQSIKQAMEAQDFTTRMSNGDLIVNVVED